MQFCYEDVAQPPWTQPDGSGLALELLRTAAEPLHETIELKPLPWKRCIASVAANEVDGAIGSADTPERRGIGQLPTRADGSGDTDAALYVDYYYVYIRNGSGASWDGRQLNLPHGSVLIPRGYHLEDNLISRGYKVNESIGSGEEGLRRLQSAQADVAILPASGTKMLAQSRRFRDAVTVAPEPWDLSPGYLLVSKARYQQDPARIQALWESIRAVRHSAAYAERVRSITGEPPIFVDATARH